MADILPPELVKPIPPQIINEGAAYGPFDLSNFIHSPNAESGDVRYFAETTDGRALPQGIICTSDGLISGIPAAGTHGQYHLMIIAENESGIPLTAELLFTIKERPQMDSDVFGMNLKSKVWEALKDNLPIPDLGDVLTRPITAIEIYYLLQQFATLSIWDVYSLEAPGEKKILELSNASPHFHIYDRGSCLVGTPKNLFSHERTLEDALQTSRVMAREVYKRGWVIEFAGFDKMVKAAWVELQLLGHRHGKMLEILHYIPSPEDVRIYDMKVKMGPAGPSL